MMIHETAETSLADTVLAFISQLVAMASNNLQCLACNNRG
jgi:hypothetical protein